MTATAIGGTVSDSLGPRHPLSVFILPMWLSDSSLPADGEAQIEGPSLEKLLIEFGFHLHRQLLTIG